MTEFNADDIELYMDGEKIGTITDIDIALDETVDNFIGSGAGEDDKGLPRWSEGYDLSIDNENRLAILSPGKAVFPSPPWHPSPTVVGDPDTDDALTRDIHNPGGDDIERYLTLTRNGHIRIDDTYRRSAAALSLWRVTIDRYSRVIEAHDVRRRSLHGVEDGDDVEPMESETVRWVPAIDDRVVVVGKIRNTQGMTILKPGRGGIVTSVRPDEGEADVRFEARGRDGMFTLTVPIRKLAPRFAWEELHGDEGMDDEEPPVSDNPAKDDYWNVPRKDKTSDCPACGLTHELDYYPLNEAVVVGTTESHGAFVHPDPRIIAAGICENDESVVLIYGEGWELKDGYSVEEPCRCSTGAPDEGDERFCGKCKQPLPSTFDEFEYHREEGE